MPGLPTSGTAIRTWGLNQGLRAHGHEVITSVPKSALNGLTKSLGEHDITDDTRKTISELETLAFSPANQSAIIAEVNPDIIICGHWPAMMLTHKPKQPLIIDLAGPHMLERHYQGTPNPAGAISAKLAVLATADYFIVSGPSQRLYFLSYLLRAEVPNAEERIITIEMPLDPALCHQSLPKKQTESYPHFLFGGVFLPWQNPEAGLRAVTSEIKKRQKGKLTLIGGTHPNYKIKTGSYEKLFRDLQNAYGVERKPMLPFSEFLGELEHADIAIDLMAWNLERQLAMTIRSTTYLAAGLPVIYNDFADLGALIKRYDAGWCASNGTLPQVLEEIFSSPEIVSRKAANAKKLAQEIFSWDRAVKPLLNLLELPQAARLKETDIIVDYPDNADFPVTKVTPIQQFFTCRLDGLSKIECRLATHNRKINKPINLSLFELASGEKHLLVKKTATLEQIENNDWFSLDVDAPIKGSAGRNFMLEISSDEDKGDLSISPWTLKSSPYPLLEMRHGDEKILDAALCLKTTCINSE